VETRRYLPGQPDYPRQLLAVSHVTPPRPLTTQGAPLEAVRAVAIVGSRSAVVEAIDFARELAGCLARAGVTVISGGALGVDAAAHAGAMDEGGPTWAVMPAGYPVHCPATHTELFTRIASTGGTLVWSLPDGAVPGRDSYLDRNGILVGLAEAVVVIQARLPSGSRNAIAWAKRMGRPVLMPGCAPWGLYLTSFSGSLQSLEAGDATPFHSPAELLRKLGLSGGRTLLRGSPRSKKCISQLPLAPHRFAVPDDTWTKAETIVFSVTSVLAEHRDQLVEKSLLPAHVVATALLTLALKDVVVEGPDGFFRRKIVG